MTSGQWFWAERNELFVTLVEHVDENAGIVEVDIGKPMFRAVRNRQ